MMNNLESIQSSPLLLGLSAGANLAIAIGLFVVLVGGWALATYNSLVRRRQGCRESWADIDAELRRRHDLIPNLVGAVKGYAAHESGVLSEVTSLREAAVAGESGPQGERSRTESKLGAGIGRLLARAEAYPDLKASANFIQLQNELAETETRIERARRFYNANTRSFRNGCEVFPSSLVAGMGGFRSAEFDFFTLDDPGEAAPVPVDFEASPPAPGS